MSKIYERIGKICELLEEYSVSERILAENIEWQGADYGAGAIPEEGWKPFPRGARWGGKPDSHCWFRFSAQLPESWKGCAAELSVSTELDGWDAANPQFLVYADGKMRQGMDTRHTVVRWNACEDKQAVLLAYTGYDVSKELELKAEFRKIDAETRALLFDIRVPYETLEYSDPESLSYSQTITALNECINLLDLREPGSESYLRSVAEARRYLRRNYYERFGGETRPTVTCVGHTHIDIAWQWPVRQTREKARRSFATVLELMRRYPEYKFFSSQPILYQMVKEDAPELYEEIKQRVAEGRWEPEGAMWVEADCNLIGGESMVRQIMFGKRFFKDEFGVENHIMWLPDVFGYSAAMPQILRLSGIDTFVTSKISWNDTDRMPYDTFTWQGIDGTGVFTYFITAQDKKRAPTERYTTYVGMGTPRQVAGTYARYGHKDLSDDAMLLYGWGDGGGGPTYEFLENIRRMDAGANDCPRARIGTASGFLQKLSAKAAKFKRLPKWSGELYLEYHRGTYTSMAKNKRNNRKSEFALRDAELFSSVAQNLTGIAYPAEKFKELWRTVLTNQFHDIIPGSSIREVYEVTDREYAQVFAELSEIQKESLGKIKSALDTKGGYFICNTNGARALDVVRDKDKYYTVSDIPAAGYCVAERHRSGRNLRVSAHRLENDWFVVVFDKKYRISRLYDKRSGREVLRPGQLGNRLIAYEDIPFIYDAWEISDYYKEKSWEIDGVLSAKTRNAGDRVEITVERPFLQSKVRQTIALYRDIPRIDFDTEADWQNEHILVKAEFPVNINSPRATYEIQFGSVERPATMNNSWEQAKFEVCAHKYADYSEYGYGVALLNDCKYGHDIHDGVISLTLWKCPTYPNEAADKGSHKFTYSLMPHEGDYREAGVIEEAYALNDPLRAEPISAQKGTLPDRFSFVECCAQNVIVETVKRAEDEDAWIVRCYEAANRRVRGRFRLGITPSSVSICDLMENDIAEVQADGNVFAYSFKPFEIVTFKVRV